MFCPSRALSHHYTIRLQSYELILNNQKKNNLIYLSFIASLVLVISGLIYLYIAITDNNIDVELAFN